MKLFLILSMTLGAGSYAVAETTDIDETITDSAHSFINRIKRRHPSLSLETVKENGFPYPNETYLDTLTEEQETALLTYIDQVNATYDFSVMTDDELKDTLLIIREDLKELCETYDLPNYQAFMMDERIVEFIKENGFTLPTERLYNHLTAEQQAIIDDFLLEVNNTYDIDNMTDDEILAAFETIKADFQTLIEEMDLDLNHHTMRERIQTRAINYVLENDEFNLPDRFYENLTEEQTLSINQFIDEVNTNYDFENMTDDEVIDALKVIRDDLKTLVDELNIELEISHHHRK